MDIRGSRGRGSATTPRVLACLSAIAVLGALAMPSDNIAAAGTVTLGVKNTSGGSPEDTVVVFDPLDSSPPPSHESAIIDQIDKKFVPRVSVMRTGTAVTFPNSDRIRHQVYSFSKPKAFSLKLYAGAPQVNITFDQPGLVVLGCNIHDSMVAFVGIVASPYFTKIPRSGTAALDLPPGRYRMRVWNPGMRADFTPREITVGSQSLTIPLSVDVDAASAVVAAWPE